jgi:hypothetical protein
MMNELFKDGIYNVRASAKYAYPVKLLKRQANGRILCERFKKGEVINESITEDRILSYSGICGVPISNFG